MASEPLECSRDGGGEGVTRGQQRGATWVGGGEGQGRVAGGGNGEEIPKEF